MFTLNPIACFKLYQFFLYLFGMHLHIIEDSLVYCKALIYLSQNLTQVFVLVVDFIFK